MYLPIQYQPKLVDSPFDESFAYKLRKSDDHFVAKQTNGTDEHAVIRGQIFNPQKRRSDTPFIKVGERFFFHDKIKNDVMHTYPNAMYFSSKSTFFTMAHFSSTYLSEIFSQNFTGERVVVVGCADGLDCVIAKRLGAEAVYGFDNKLEYFDGESCSFWECRFQYTLSTNGLVNDSSIQFHCLDCLAEETMSLIESLKPTVLLMNMGPFYGEIDLKVVTSLVNQCKALKKMILAGYVAFNKAGLQTDKYPTNMASLVGELGFDIVSETSAWPIECAVQMPAPALAFTCVQAS